MYCRYTNHLEKSNQINHDFVHDATFRYFLHALSRSARFRQLQAGGALFLCCFNGVQFSHKSDFFLCFFSLPLVLFHNDVIVKKTRIPFISQPCSKTIATAAAAQVAGYGATCDAHHITAPAPDGNGLARAIGTAMKMGGITPEVRLQPEGASRLRRERLIPHRREEVFGGRVPFFWAESPRVYDDTGGSTWRHVCTARQYGKCLR